MSYYEWIIENIKLSESQHNCPSTLCINPKKEKELKGKSFEQVKEEASKYGLYLNYNNNYNIAYDTHTYVFSLQPLNEMGFPIKKWNEQ